MSRKIEIQNEKILESIKQTDECIKRQIVLVSEGEKIEKEGEELLQKMARYQEKVQPELKREVAKIEMGEFEEFSRCYLGKEGEEEGKLYIEIADRLEEFKEGFKKQKNEQNNSGNSLPEGGECGKDDCQPS